MVASVLLAGVAVTLNVTVGVADHYPFIESVTASGAVNWTTGILHHKYTSDAFRALGRPTVGRAPAAGGGVAPAVLRLCDVTDCAPLVAALPGMVAPEVELSFGRGQRSCDGIVRTIGWLEHIASAGLVPINADCGTAAAAPADDDNMLGDQTQEIMVIVAFVAALLAFGLLVGILVRPQTDGSYSFRGGPYI